MKPKKRCNLSGLFIPEARGAHAWRLRSEKSSDVTIFLGGAEPAAAEVLLRASISDVGIDWHGDQVSLHLTADGRSRTFQAQSAIIHEPLGRLYETLPLAGFDAKARRFWSRVFFLTRIPGGRALLKLLARKTRDQERIRDTDHKTR